MDAEEKIITIQGKQINYGNLSDEKLLQLYKELRQREVILYERILKNLNEANLIEN